MPSLPGKLDYTRKAIQMILRSAFLQAFSRKSTQHSNAGSTSIPHRGPLEPALARADSLSFSSGVVSLCLGTWMCCAGTQLRKLFTGLMVLIFPYLVSWPNLCVVGQRRCLRNECHTDGHQCQGFKDMKASFTQHWVLIRMKSQIFKLWSVSRYYSFGARVSRDGQRNGVT